ncbi:MAG: hypothetical protein QOE80_627 [Actinomycetota bacterium]|jgi:hypothetical protein|nr:hypothetical protein [Actinomycetota bacterium]
MRKIHSLGLVGAVALVLAAVVAPAANGAVTRVETDQFSGVASAQALDLSLLGRRLTFGIASVDSAANVVNNTLNQKASGIGTLLSPKTAITAAQGDQPANGGRACFQPPLGEALAGANLPSLLIGEVACGEASTKGDVSSFEAVGTGTVASLRLNATQILKPALDALKPVLDTVAATPVGDLLKATDAPAKTAVTTLNGLLGSLLGQGSVVLPTLEPSQTVKDVVNRLEDSDLLRVNIGNAIAKNTGTAANFTSESLAQGGTIEVLPAFRGLGLPPLLKITTGESGASVTYDRDKTAGVGSAKNTLVRIESELLPTLGLGQIGLAGVKPLETLTGTLGIKSGPGFIELAPGQNVTLFCDGAVGVLGALCTEISVGTPHETKLPDGSIKEESAAVTIHLFKGLNNLVPGLNLGSVLGNAALDTVLAPVSGATGLSLGEKTDVPGIRLALAQTVAQAGGTKVMGQVEEKQRAAAAEVPASTPAPAAALPRTGGLPFRTGTIPALLGVSLGVGTFLRRRRG